MWFLAATERALLRSRYEIWEWDEKKGGSVGCLLAYLGHQGTCLTADPLLIWSHPCTRQFTYRNCTIRFQFSVRYRLCV